MRYRAFRTKKDDQFYFQFLTEGGDTVLRSQAYADKNACFNGIKSVMSNSGDTARYQKLTENGKHFFILKAGNNQEIGRSVPYDSEADADKGIALMMAEGPSATNKSDAGKAKATPPPAPAAPVTTEKKAASSSSADDYRPLAFYEAQASSENGFDSFRDGDDGEHYFAYSVDGSVVLISEGYSSDKGRDNGINSVTKNLPIPERYKKAVHSNGKHYFGLRAGNNQEIATSRWFDSEAEMDSYITAIQGGDKGIAALKASRSQASSSASADSDPKSYKDYKPLGFYEERIEGEKFGFDAFSEGDASYFTINYDGAPLLLSEDYTTAAGRDNGISSVKKNVKNEKRYERKVHSNGKYYFNLKAGNKQEIATSRWFDSEKDMEKAIAWLTSTGGTRRRKKAAREKTEGERVYISQGGGYMCSNIKYDTFQSGGNQKYYFVFKTEDDKVILINGDVRGHKSIEELNATIEQVLKLAPYEKNYFRKETKNGKYYFYVRNEDEKNVARGSLFYAEKSDMEAAIKLLACGKVGAGSVIKSAATPLAVVATTTTTVESKSAPKAVVDDYLPCKAYAGEAGFHKFINEASGEYYFAYNNTDGKTMLRSEGYSSAAGRDNGIESVIKNAPNEDRWKTGTELDGRYHYYSLRAGNNQEIARSCYYQDQAAMAAAFAWVRGEHSPIGAGSAIVGGALMSAFMMSSQKANAKANEEANALRLKAEADANAAAAAKAKAEAEARLKAEAEARARAEEEARLKAEAAAKIRAEENAERLRLEAEARTKAEAEATRLRLEAEAKADADRKKAAAVAAAAAAAAALAARNKANAETERLRLEAEAKSKAEAESRRLKLEAEAKANAERLRLEAEAKAETERLRLASEAKAKADAEAKRLKVESDAAAAKKAAAASAAAAAALALAAKEKSAKQAEETRLLALKKAESAKLAAAAAAKKVPAAATVAATTKVVAESSAGGGWGWLKWLLPLLLLLALLFFFLKGCGGCGGGVKTPPPVVTPPVIETPTDPVPEPEIVPLGKTCEELNMKSESVCCAVSDYLSNPNTKLPKEFSIGGASFGNNSARLSSAAKKQLDDLTTCLKEYGNANIDIYGYLKGSEKGAFRGSKEISLDDVRARNVRDYLQSRGIPASRMNFEGNGTGDTNNVRIRITNR